LTKQTANLKLSKPEMADKISTSITQLANNFDAIDATFQDHKSRVDNIVAGAGNSNTEIVDARGGKVVLKDRLDAVDVSLEEKASRADLNTTNNNVNATNTRIDTLVINSGNANAEVTDAHVSTVKNKSFTTIRNRLEEIESSGYVPIQNLILNGSFENGLTSWINNSTGTATVETTIVKNGTKSMRHTPASGTMEYVQKITAPIGNLIYHSAFCYIVSLTSGSPRMILADYSAATNPIYLYFDKTKTGVWQQASAIRKVNDTGARIAFDTDFGSDAVYDAVVAIDLTSLFGAGNEPSKQEMDNILSQYFNYYFDATANLFIANKMFSNIVRSVTNKSIGVANGIADLDSTGKIRYTVVPTDVSDTVNEVFTVSKNLFDSTQATVNKAVSLVDGSLYDYTGYYASGYIPVKSGLKYVASGNQTKYYAWYDANKVFISSAQDLTNMVAPTNAAYIRISINPADYPTYQFEQGNVQTAYIPYGTKQSKIQQLQNVNKTRWYGKKANFLGDSITWGYSPVGDGSRLTNQYPALVGNTLGLSVVRNYGISGSTLADKGDGTSNPMVSRYSSMDNDADLIFVLGGTNDWAVGKGIGTINDTTIYTFYGALNVLVQGLLDKYPTQTIVLATPLHRQGDTGNAGLVNYRNAILAIGEKYGLAVCDLYATSGFYPDNTTNYNAICPDGRHPNDAGQIKLANRVAGFLTTV
jgi:lysophospholipase L1-like esterase